MILDIWLRKYIWTKRKACNFSHIPLDLSLKYHPDYDENSHIARPGCLYYFCKDIFMKCQSIATITMCKSKQSALIPHANRYGTFEVHQNYLRHSLTHKIKDKKRWLRIKKIEIVFLFDAWNFFIFITGWLLNENWLFAVMVNTWICLALFLHATWYRKIAALWL